MRKFFYARLAGGNIRRNSSTYYPYILAAAGLIAAFFNITILASNPEIENMPSAGNLMIMFSLGSTVLGVFSAILLVYANSFVLKRRKKELGLYNVLGMEKRHIARLFLWESVIVSGASLGFGLGIGALFSRLVFLLLEKVLQFSKPLPFSMQSGPFILTGALFLGIFVLIYMLNLLRIWRLNPLELLMGSRTGEKEPKASWIITLLGILLLGGGYYLAIAVADPVEAFAFFFVAVALVILGTYALFTSGSIALLKAARKNKRVYYQPENFISISGMMYRMKQNAAGLAGICILCTMVLVAVSTTVSLYSGTEDTLRSMYPFDIIASTPLENGDAVRETADALIQAENMATTNSVDYRMRSAYAYFEEDGIDMLANYYNDRDRQPEATVYMMPLDDYNAYTGQDKTLNAGEMLLYSDRPEMFSGEVALGGKNYQVKENIPEFYSARESLISNMFNCVMVLPEIGDLNFLLEDSEDAAVDRFICYDLDADDQTQIDFAAALRATLNEKQLMYHDEGGDFALENRAGMRAEWHSMYGGFLFLGVFLGIVFTIATALMIYYKQLSEGFDDHDRFEIMQKVGMSRQEVKTTIDKQIRAVFFLPLIAAIVHIAFAFNMIRRLLVLFGLNNIPLFIVCMAGTALIFTAIYMAIYRTTARSYYKLV